MNNIDVIRRVAGELGIKIAKIIGKRKNVSEFKLAEKADLDIHAARNVLYKLHEKGLATFIRKKDQKKGWYICYWTMQPEGIKKEGETQKKDRLELLNEKIEREKSGQFFICENKCARVHFEQAFGFEFRCPECGLVMNIEDNAQQIIDIEKEIKEIRNT